MKNIELKKKEAEIMALQSQIDPHFLFNTLESIRMALIRKDDRENANAVFSMSRLLKASYSLKSDRHRIKDEITFVEDYLMIQKFKFKDKITFTIDVIEACHEYFIPKLTVQPIIENAIKHGFSLSKGPCNIHLRIREVEDAVLIEIEDNGTGIDLDILQDINDVLSKHEDLRSEKYIGLKNVHERIMLYYGPEYGLKIHSEKNVGTRVTITIPVDRTGER